MMVRVIAWRGHHGWTRWHLEGEGSQSGDRWTQCGRRVERVESVSKAHLLTAYRNADPCAQCLKRLDRDTQASLAKDLTSAKE